MALDAALAANRAAVTEMLAACDRTGDAWSRPPAPGKWSPAQVAEHVARALEDSGKVIAGQPSRFPTLPGPIKWLARTLLFDRVLKNGRFPKAKTNKAMDPDRGPATPAEARARLEGALGALESAARAASAATIATATFGTVGLEDYVRFQEIHVRHHARQVGA